MVLWRTRVVFDRGRNRMEYQKQVQMISDTAWALLIIGMAGLALIILKVWG